MNELIGGFILLGLWVLGMLALYYIGRWRKIYERDGKVIYQHILEEDGLEAAESFQRGWQDVINGKTYPIELLWIDDEIEIDENEVQ